MSKLLPEKQATLQTHIKKNTVDRSHLFILYKKQHFLIKKIHDVVIICY